MYTTVKALMENILNFLNRYWRLLLVGVFVALLAYVFLFRGLNTLTGSLYSQTEIQSQQQSASLTTIYHNPVNAPYKALVWLGLKLGHHSILVTRVAAASLAVGVAVLFYWVALHWYSKRVALMATVLFVSSSGFLHIGRYGTGLILQMATLALISCVFLYRRTKHEYIMAYLLLAVLAAILYIPGMVWFELIGLYIMRKRILQLFRKMGRVHTGLIWGLGIVLLAPLLWVSAHNTSILREIAGLPASIPSLKQLAENTLHLVSSVGYRGYWPTEFWLYGAPLLNIGEVILFITGFVLLLKKPILRGNYFLLGALVVSTVLILLGGSATIAMLTPLAYLTIAGGLFYLLDQWLSIFPRNPIARFTGIALIGVLGFFSVLYHIGAYYTAWPNAPETKAVYTVVQPS